MNRILWKSAVIIAVIFLVACHKLDWQPFDDTLMEAKENSTYTLAVGQKGIYCLAGRYAGFHMQLDEGMFWRENLRHYFRIKELIAKYPALETENVKAAIIRQEKLISKLKRF